MRGLALEMEAKRLFKSAARRAGTSQDWERASMEEQAKYREQARKITKGRASLGHGRAKYFSGSAVYC